MVGQLVAGNVEPFYSFYPLVLSVRPGTSPTDTFLPIRVRHGTDLAHVLEHLATENTQDVLIGSTVKLDSTGWVLNSTRNIL